MATNLPTHESTAYTYRYNCKRWWGSVTGTRNIIYEGDDIEQAALKDAERVSGSGTCDVALMQKFYITVQLAEPYRALMQFPCTFDKKDLGHW